MLTAEQHSELRLICLSIRQDDPYNRGWSPAGLRNWATGVHGMAETEDADLNALQLARATATRAESLPFYAQLNTDDKEVVKQSIAEALQMNDFIKFRARHIELCRDAQIYQMYVQYLKVDSDIQDLFDTELKSIVCIEGKPNTQALHDFEDKWVQIIGKSPDVFIDHIRKAATLKDTLFYMRFFVYSLRQYQRYMRFAPTSVHGFVNQYNAVAINAIIDELEVIRSHIYEDRADLTYAQNIAAASKLLDNPAFIGLAPGVLITFLRDLKSIGAVYGRLEQHLNLHEYDEAAAVAQELVATEGFKNLVPPRYHDYFEVLARVCDVSRKLQAGDAPADLPGRVGLIQTLLTQSCVHHIHDRFQKDGVPDASYVDMTQQLSEAANHLELLLKSSNLLDVSKHLKGLSSVVTQSPLFRSAHERFKDLLLASTAAEEALTAIEAGNLYEAIPQLQKLRSTALLGRDLPPVVSDLLVIIEEVESIRELVFSDGGTKETQDLRYHEGIARLSALRDNSAFIRFAPASLKAFAGHVEGFSEAYGEIEAYLNQKAYALAAQKARLLCDQPHFKAICPERLKKYINALAKTYDLHQHLQAIDAKGEAVIDRLDAKRDQIHRFIHSTSFKSIYGALLTPNPAMPLDALQVNLASMIEALIGLSTAKDAQDYIQHAGRLSALISKNPHLFVSKHADLQSASEACQQMTQAINHFEVGQTTLGIEALNALVSNRAFKMYTPDFAPQLIDLIHEFEAIRSEFFGADGPINYSALYARIDHLQSNHPSYKIIMPSSIQKTVRDIKQFMARYQAIEDLVNEKCYAQAAKDANALLSDPAFLNIVPERYKKYLQLLCGTYQLIIAPSEGLTDFVRAEAADTLAPSVIDAQTALSSQLNAYVHSAAFEAVYRGVFHLESGSLNDIQSSIVVMIETCAAIQAAKTPQVFCEQVAVLMAHLKDNPQMKTHGNIIPLLHDMEGMASLMSDGLLLIEAGKYGDALAKFKTLSEVPSFKAYVPPMVGDFILLIAEINDIRVSFFNHEGDLNYSDLLKRIELLNTLPAYQVLAPDSIKTFIADLSGIANDYKEIEQLLNEKEYSKAAIQARLLSQKESFKTLAPIRTHKYLSAFATTFDLGRTLIGSHEMDDLCDSHVVPAAQAIQDYINSPSISALYALQFKTVSEAQFSDFQANTVKSLHLFTDLMQQDDVRGFLNISQSLVELLRLNNAISPNRGIVQQLQRFEDIIGVVNAALNDINEGRYSSAISSINKLNKNAMFVDVAPQFVASMLENLESLNRQYEKVEQAIKASNFREASQLTSKLLDSRSYRRLMPKHLQQYSNALIKAEEAYSKILGAARSANYKVAHDHLLDFINAEHGTDVYNTLAFMFGEKDFNEFKTKLTDRTYVITDLLRNLTNKSGSPVQGFIYWAHQHQQVLFEDFSMIAFIEESMDTPEARLLANVRTLFAARGFPRQCPSYNDLSISENFYLMGYIEEYIFERSQEANESRLASIGKPETLARPADSEAELQLAAHVTSSSSDELHAFLLDFNFPDEQHHLNMNAIYADGQTLLHLAAQRGDMAMITFLLNHPHIAHANWENERGLTPMMIAALKGNIDLLKLFTDASHRVAINHANDANKTVLDMVYANRTMPRATRAALTEFLLSQGALTYGQIRPQGPTTQTFAFIRNIVLDALFYATHFLWRKVRQCGAFMHRCVARIFSCSSSKVTSEETEAESTLGLKDYEAKFKATETPADHAVTRQGSGQADYLPAQAANGHFVTQDDSALVKKQSHHSRVMRRHSSSA